MKPKQWKPGDRCSVYRGGFKNPIKGTVTHINEEFSSIGFTEDGFYSAHNDSPFHYKQCVPLVKKKRERVFIVSDHLGTWYGKFKSKQEAGEHLGNELTHEILECIVAKRWKA